MAEENHPEQRPGPFAQDRTGTPPTKEQREKDYQPEKKDTGEAIKGKDSQGIVRDERGQDEPGDKDRVQHSSSRKQRGETDPPLPPRPRE